MLRQPFVDTTTKSLSSRIYDRQIGAQQFMEEFVRLPQARIAQRIVVILVLARIDHHGIEFTGPHPLADEVLGELPGARIGEHPLDFGSKRCGIAELLLFDQFGAWRIGDGAPQIIRQPIGELMLAQIARLAVGRRGFIEEEEGGRNQHACYRWNGRRRRMICCASLA